MIQGLAVKTWNHHVSLQQDINSLQQTLTDLRLRVNELKTEAMARENDVLCGQIEAQEKQIRDLDEFLASLGHVEIRKV